MSDFTLIIPTHNRHHYLKRSMAYFKDLDANIIYCDSSSEKYEGELYPNMNYLHLPDKKFAEKILFALSEIKTNFVALCADDDFIVIQSLYKGISFLNENKNYKTVVGKYISFKDVFDGNYYPMYQAPPNDVDLGIDKNAEVFFKNYYQILWGMYDKEVLVKAFQIINKAKFHNDNFIELVIGTCACYAGAIKFLDEIWGVREICANDHWGSRHLPITTMKIAEINGDFKKFEELVDLNTFTGCADIVINSYLSGQVINSGSLRTKISGLIPEFIKMRVREKAFFKNVNPQIDLNQKSKELLHSITLLLSKENSMNN